MEEALGVLSTCISSGPNWPYVLTQLYEGTNHAPLPKDKHLGILPQGKAESLCGWISQLKVCHFLSAGLQVIYPMGLNGGNQSVTIDLPGPLHHGSSVTTNEHPYIKIDIPSPTPEEQDHANPPLGRVHATLAIAMPKTPWKPRVTLTAEVDNLLTWGMTEDYNHEPERSAMVKELATKADTSPPPKMEVPALPLDTSSQVSVAETEASMESNPICDSPTAVAYSSHSDSPTMDLPELQADTNLAVNHMLSIKRSWDLEKAMGNLGFWGITAPVRSWRSHHQWKSQDCPLKEGPQWQDEVCQGSYESQVRFRVTVQEARAIRCSKLKESEAAYLEALSDNVAAKSLQCATLHREHVKHMCELEEWALDVENKSCQDFLFAHQAVLRYALQSLKENLHSSYHILLGQSSSSLWSIPFARAPQAEGQPPVNTPPRPESKWSPWPKRQNSLPDAQGDMSIDENSPWPCRKDRQAPREGRLLTGLPL